ncbi:winged helix-turn-helix domain-containing protein [Streptacidiphilus sp. EB129]|uniref:winged helix-turn-helix domain-containing protein n=1 Tax=Streptacidiphilus sp. EB129 TaxID=3156262 RepID=UPI003517B06F
MRFEGGPSGLPAARRQDRQGVVVLRIDMDGAALANTRFAISPLHTTVDALWLLKGTAPAGAGAWRELVLETVRDRRLSLLGSLFGGSWDYVPDFVTPQPQAPESGFEDELQAVVGVGSERLRWELDTMIRGNPAERLAGRPAPRAVLDVLEQGESALAERVAAELDQVWRAAIGPHWVGLRARLEADIARRSRTIVGHGMSAMLTSLHPRVVWQGDHLRLLSRFEACIPGTTSLVLTPSVFNTDLHMTIDSMNGPAPRQPMLGYPALRGPESADPGGPALPAAHALLGVTRARLLSDLRSPRSTVELGERHRLSASTVSYHLGILHRSGLVTRTRSRHRVLYEQTPRATSLLVGTNRTRSV